MNQLHETLTRCRIFSQVDAGGLLRLTAMAQPRHFERGRVIFREGDPCPGMFIVGSGSVRVYKLAPTGKEHVLHLPGPGQTFAEVATIGGFDCPASAEALEPTDCVLLPAKAFRRALREDHDLCLQLLGGMAGRVQHFVGLLEDIVLRDAISRTARYLLDSADNDGLAVLATTKRQIANHLNLTSETLSRSLRRLTDAGLIESVNDREIRILDADRLRALADQDGSGDMLDI